MQVTSDHRFQTITDARTFVLAGNAIVTLQSTRTGSHFTYKISSPSAEKQEAKGFTPEAVWFVKVLSGGSADEGQWTYLGMIKNGGFFSTRASAHMQTAPCFKAFQWFFNVYRDGDAIPENLVIRHENHCCRCGRTLTTPESIERGIGPECLEKMGL